MERRRGVNNDLEGGVSFDSVVESSFLCDILDDGKVQLVFRHIWVRIFDGLSFGF